MRRRLQEPGFWDLWGTDADHVWAVGGEGTILFWDGATWSVQPTDTNHSFFSVHGLGPDQVWAGCMSGIYFFDGFQWQRQWTMGWARYCVS